MKSSYLTKEFFFGMTLHAHAQYTCTPQPLYNTIVGVQANFRVSYPIRVIWRVKLHRLLRLYKKGVLNTHSGSNTYPSYIQNRIVTNRVIKRFRCIFIVNAKYQKLSVKALLQVDFPVYAQAKFLFKSKQEKMADFKEPLFCQKTFFWHQTSSSKCSMSLYCVGKILNCFGTSCGTS